MTRLSLEERIARHEARRAAAEARRVKREAARAARQAAYALRMARPKPPRHSVAILLGLGWIVDGTYSSHEHAAERAAYLTRNPVSRQRRVLIVTHAGPKPTTGDLRAAVVAASPLVPGRDESFGPRTHLAAKPL